MKTFEKHSSKLNITKEQLEREIKRAFMHGQGNGQMMEAGLERDEIDDYTNSVMNRLLKQDEHVKEIPVKLVGYLTKAISHMEIGHPVYETPDRYVMEETSLTDGSLHEVRYYKQDLAPFINFIEK